MTPIRVFLSRALDLVLRRRRDQRLSEEIETHLDLLAAEQMRLGLNEEEARRAARRAFGGVARIKEQYQDQRGLPLVDTTLQDLRLAIRLLWRAPGFAFSAVAVLGLGIGVNNMLFTILNAHTIRGLPMPDADRVLYLTTRDDRSPDLGVSFLDFSDWQAGARTLSDWPRSLPNRSSCPATGARRPRFPGRSFLTRPSASSALSRCSAAISQQKTTTLVRPRSSSLARTPGNRVMHATPECSAARSPSTAAGRRGRSHARAFRFPLERSDLAPALTGPRPPTAAARRASAARHRPRPGRRPALASPGRTRNDHRADRI